jgi:hypothetical protein
MVVLDWYSEEVKGDFPRSWTMGVYHHFFDETESLIIERARKKIVNRLSEEKMTPRERFAKCCITREAIDHCVAYCLPNQATTSRVMESYSPLPPFITQRDMIEYPNLYWLTEMLYHNRFSSDLLFSMPWSFSEEITTKKFKMIEHGPPLAVEPIASNKEELEYFIKNVPNPAISGLYPLQLWTLKQRIKFLPEFPAMVSNCPGVISGAAVLRGIKDFLLDLNKNPEMAALALKASVTVLKKRVDASAEVLGQDLDASGKGNPMYFCDGAGSYMTFDQYDKTFEHSYGALIPYIERKGFRTYMFLGGGGKIELEIKTDSFINEHGGGSGKVGAIGATPMMKQFEELDKFDKVVKHFLPGTKVLLNGPTDAIRAHYMEVRDAAAKYGHGTALMFSNNFDAQTPIEHIDYVIKVSRELFQYPVQ